MRYVPIVVKGRYRVWGCAYPSRSVVVCGSVSWKVLLGFGDVLSQYRTLGLPSAGHLCVCPYGLQNGISAIFRRIEK